MVAAVAMSAISAGAATPADLVQAAASHRTRLTRALSISFMNAVDEGEMSDLLSELRTPMIHAALLSPPSSVLPGPGGPSLQNGAISAAATPSNVNVAVGAAMSAPALPQCSTMFGCECAECVHSVKDVLKEVRATALLLSLSSLLLLLIECCCCCC